MILREKQPPSGRQLFTLCIFALGIIAAIVLRVTLYPTITSDYTTFVSNWYDHIKANGGFAAFKDDFYNYNPPYLYLLAIATYLPLDKLVAIKSISVIFDGVLAVFTYLIIQLKYQRALPALLGALVMLFAPTIFLNSAAWGQCDAIYAAFCLGSLYFLLKGKAGWACAFFGIAIAFKLQAIFFLPILLLLLYKKRLSFGYLALIPLIFVLALAPAFIAGRSAGSLLSIYVQQTETGGVGGMQFGGPNSAGNRSQFTQRYGTGFSGNYGSNTGGPGNVERPNNQWPQYGQGGQGFQGNQRGMGGNMFTQTSLTYNAPTIYQWLPTDGAGYWKWIGIGLAGLFVIGVAVLVLASKKQLTTETMLKIAIVLLLGIPFFLPDMHERYFYLADVLSIVFAFYFPYLFFIPLIVQLCSLSSYAPYLWQNEIVSLAVVAGGILLMIIVTLMDLAFTLYPTFRRLIVQPEAMTDIGTPVQDHPSLSEEPQQA